MKIELLEDLAIRFRTKDIATDADKAALCGQFEIMMNAGCVEQEWTNSDIDDLVQNLPKTSPVTVKTETVWREGRDTIRLVFRFGNKALAVD